MWCLIQNLTGWFRAAVQPDDIDKEKKEAAVLTNLWLRLPDLSRTVTSAVAPHLCCFMSVHSPPSWGSRLYRYR